MKLPDKFYKKTKIKARVGLIIFDSQGGDLFEGMKIGKLIRNKMISTQVTHDATCHSACVIAFLGGVERTPVGPMGIHSFYSTEFIGELNFTLASDKYNAISSQVEKYLNELRIPVTILDEMKKIPYYDLKIIDAEQVESLGLLGIDPVYAQMLHDSRRKK